MKKFRIYIDVRFGARDQDEALRQLGQLLIDVANDDLDIERELGQLDQMKMRVRPFPYVVELQ